MIDISELKIAKIKEMIESIKEEEYLSYVEILSKDSRNAVKDMAVRLAKKIDAIEKEDKRLYEISQYERGAFERGFKFICGLDEVGRGPLAGPVVAGAVIFKEGEVIRGINDSKKLSEQRREELFEEITEKAIAWAVGIVDNEAIDEFNILNATKMAMKQAINRLSVDPDYLLLDALRLDGIELPQEDIIKGDSKSMSIAGASIVAKVTRDRMIKEYGEIYPEYGFNSHKGYGTKEHYEALKKYGLTPIHRKSFLKNL